MTHEDAIAAILAREQEKGVVSEAELRQQLADVTNERDGLLAERNCQHEWTDDGEFNLTCTKCGKQENDEPYGWVQTRGDAINHFTQEWDVVEGWMDRGFEYKEMFDHPQSAPASKACTHDFQREGPDYFVCRKCSQSAPAAGEQGAGS